MRRLRGGCNLYGRWVNDCIPGVCACYGGKWDRTWIRKKLTVHRLPLHVIVPFIGREPELKVVVRVLDAFDVIGVVDEVTGFARNRQLACLLCVRGNAFDATYPSPLRSCGKSGSSGSASLRKRYMAADGHG